MIVPLRLLWLALALAVAATPAAAQEPTASSGSGPLVKYGKWVLAAGAIGMNYLAARAHDRADERFDLLQNRCFDERALCSVDAAGTYTNGESERIYQESLRYDRQARRWLFGGETALVASAALFIWELTRRNPKPDNIPFEPEVRSLRQATGVGVRLDF
jgi:hypothetical protein